jgi:hypothetical protein
MARYVEMVVQGDDRDLKAYLTASSATAGHPRFVFADETGFHVPRLRERIRHHGEVQHVIVAEEHAALVRTDLGAAGPRYSFEIKEERTLETVRFPFEFSTPSRKVAADLKHLLGMLPTGAHLEGYVPQEKADKDASGTEIYAPEHDYVFSGRGTIHGDVFAVIDARAKLSAIDFTDCGEIVVDGA